MSEKFSISLKTVHDAVKLLAKEGIVYTRRGQYGTIVMSITDSKPFEFYNYEKVEGKIRHYIKLNCKVGDKLPSIKMFAKEYSTSAKTIKKALDNLAEEGVVTFVRGRFGGTFVTNIPNESDSYTWLAISSDYVNNGN